MAVCRHGSLRDTTVRPSFFFLRDNEHDKAEAAVNPASSYKYTIENADSADAKVKLESELSKLAADGEIGLFRGYKDPVAGAAQMAGVIHQMLHAVLCLLIPLLRILLVVLG